MLHINIFILFSYPTVEDKNFVIDLHQPNFTPVMKQVPKLS